MIILPSVPTYGDADGMWAAALKQLLMQKPAGSRNGSARESFGWCAKLADPTAAFVVNHLRAASASYACAELLWYVSKSRSIDMISTYAPSYAKFSNDGMAMGAYGSRWRDQIGFAAKRAAVARDAMESQKSLASTIWADDQIRAAIHLLKTKPDTRQAVVAHWDSGDLVEAVRGEWRDLPCTVSLQFKMSGGRLHAMTHMRSNDAWLGMPYDVFCFCAVQRMIAAELGVEPGHYVHSVGSMHLYDRDRDKAAEALAAFECGDVANPDPQATAPFGTLADFEAAVSRERVIRETGSLPSATTAVRGSTAFADDCVRCCANKLWSIQKSTELLGPVHDARLLMGVTADAAREGKSSK